MIKLVRVAITLFACYVMCFTPASGVDFFRSLIILSMGYAYDYYSIKNFAVGIGDKYNKVLGWVGAVVALIFFFIWTCRIKWRIRDFFGQRTFYGKFVG